MHAFGTWEFEIGAPRAGKAFDAIVHAFPW